MAIYFIRSGENGPVKIGTAEDPGSRLRELQCGNPEPLICVRTIDGGLSEERWLHRHYAAHRYRGEWFNYCSTMETIVPPGAVRGWVPEAFREAVKAAGGPIPFGERIGVTGEAVRLWCLGRRTPRQEHLIAIMAETGGIVTANDFLPLALAGSKPSSRRSA